MDYRTLILLCRTGHYVPPPSPFAEPHVWKRTADHIWRILRTPSLQTLWLKDRGLYIKAVQCAKYCEGRAC